MAHEQACGNATITKRNQCGCDCGGRLHGVPHSERGRAFYEPAGTRANSAASRTASYRSKVGGPVPAARRRVLVSDFMGAKLTEEAIRSGFQLEPFVDDITAAVTERLAGAALTPADRTIIRRRFRAEHLFCTLAVYIVRVFHAVDKVVIRVRNLVVDEILNSVFGPPTASMLTAAGRAAVRTALRAGINAGVRGIRHLTGSQHAVATVRLLGVLACPDIERHPRDAVTRYCVLPLTTQFLTTLSRARVQTWVRGGFVGNPPA